MKTKVTLEVDLEQITNELLTEDQAGYWSITRQVRDELKKSAVEQIKQEVLKVWGIDNIEQWAMKSSFSMEKYLTSETKKYLDAEVGKYAQGYLKNWMEKQFSSFIDRTLEEMLEERITPIFNNLIKKLLVFNTSALADEQRAMDEITREQVNAAYEQGREDEYKHKD